MNDCRTARRKKRPAAAHTRMDEYAQRQGRARQSSHAVCGCVLWPSTTGPCMGWLLVVGTHTGGTLCVTVCHCAGVLLPPPQNTVCITGAWHEQWPHLVGCWLWRTQCACVAKNCPEATRTPTRHPVEKHTFRPVPRMITSYSSSCGHPGRNNATHQCTTRRLCCE